MLHNSFFYCNPAYWGYIIALLRSMKKYFTKELGLILAISILPIFIVYLPFILKIKHFYFLDLHESGVLQLVRNFDGPQFLVVAKSFYDKNIIVKLLFNAVDDKYYAAHFPLFPLFIRSVTPFFGWFYSGLVVNLFFGFLANLMFFHLAKKYTKSPFFLTFLFTVFPARFWIIRSIISPETMMIFFIMLSFWFWDKKQYLNSSVSGALAVLTKFQSLFLFPAYCATIIESWYKDKKIPKPIMMSVLLIPFSYILLSVLFLIKFNDFNAFFHAESHNNLYIYFPFSQFNSNNSWIGTGWLEDVVFYLVALITLTITLYYRKERVWFYFSLFYTLFLILLPHRDISRYSFQLLPIFLLTFEQFLTSKPFKYGLILSLPALYFYTLNFIMTNQAGVADWNHFLR